MASKELASINGNLIVLDDGELRLPDLFFAVFRGGSMTLRFYKPRWMYRPAMPSWFARRQLRSASET